MDVELTPREYQQSIYDSIMRNGNTLVVLPTGLGKCLEFSQPVLLADGTLVKIGEIFENAAGELIKNEKNHISIKPLQELQVISLNSDLKLEKTKVIAVHKIKAGKKLIKIITAAGSEIIVTPEHPLLTLGKGVEWKRADKFNVNEPVAVPACLPEPVATDEIDMIEIFTKINRNVNCFVGLTRHSARNYGLDGQEQNLEDLVNKIARIKELKKDIEYVYIKGGRSNQTPITAVKRMTPDLFYWAGLAIAEGCSYGSLKFFNEDSGLLGLFSGITERIFGLTTEKIRGGLRVRSTALHFFARNLFDVRNQHSRYKTISDRVMSSNNKNVAGFISGLYDGEGSVRSGGVIEFMTASTELAHKLCYLLLRFGIKTRIKKKICSATNSPHPKRREYYRVYVEGVRDLKRFNERIGFRHKEKQRKLGQYLAREIRYNPNFNLVPLPGKLIREIKEHLGLSSTKWKDFEIPGIDTYERGERKFSHETLRKAVTGFEAKEEKWDIQTREKIEFLKRLLDSDIYWDKIKNIEKVREEWVYDLSLDANFNFIAGRNGGFISHNTLIGLMLIKERMKSGRCLFLTPTKPLAKQHAQTIAKVLGLSEKNVSLINGEIAPKKRKEMYQTDVIVSTPQTIKNDLENGILEPDFSLAIFDECHRSVGNYAYTYVAEKLSGGRKAGERAPRGCGKDSDGRDDEKGSAIGNEPCLFVGLTASPGGKMERIREVMGALRIDNVEIRDQNDPDVAQYVQKSVMTWVPVDLSDHFKDIKRELDSLAGKYAKRLSGMGFPPPLKHKGKFMELRQRILNIPNNIKYAALVQYSVLLHLLHMTELLETQGVYPVREYLLKLEEKEGKSAKILLSEPQLAQIRALCQKEEDHPKMPVLIERLKALAAEKKKVIVFAQYRSQIARIEKVVNESGISARQFVGKKDGVTKKIQEEAIADFRAGKFDVMVASSIAEEGLDIPAVDAVIFYEPIPSEIRSIQRRGRAARLKEGEIIVLMTRGTRDEFYYHASRNREGRMKTILKGMQKGKRDKESASSRTVSAKEMLNVKQVPKPPGKALEPEPKQKMEKQKTESGKTEPEAEKQTPDPKILVPKRVPAKSASRAKKTSDDGQTRMTDFL